MNLRRITSRVAVAGATTALAAGALVAATGTAAHAETKTTTYTCSVFGNDLPVLVTVAAELPVSSFPTHAQAPAGIALNGSFTVPRAVLDGLGGFGVHQVGVSTEDLALPLGTSAIPLTGVATPLTDVPATGDLTLPFAAKTAAFEMPDPGTYQIQMPSAFAADIATDGLGTLPDVPCTIDPAADPDITAFTVTKQSATVAGKAPVKVKKGKAFKVVTTVSGQNVTATGKVVAKDGKTTLGKGTLKKGKVTIVVKKGLKKLGVHTINLFYSGDKRTAPSQGGVLVNVVKK